jgi:hypothetical protein
MTIDQGALSHIMSVLTDLYSDPELAIIREYSTNALDAHVEAGETRPIEVTLPSPLSPFLRIRDYGVGLDVADIRDIYSRYGTSTKRQSNDVVGMLGLGCKSALTYADQFTLASVKDERRVTVSVSRDEDGSGSMTIVSDERTSDPNGTEVIIPAKRDNTMADTAADFFRFWDEGTVLVNGKQPERIGGMWVNDKILVTESVDTPQIVMGNVAYPCPGLDMRDRLGWHSKVVAWVDIGTVAFTPSREALQDTKQTREEVGRVKAHIMAQMDASFKAQIEAAESPQDMLKLYLEARLHGYGNGLRNRIVPPHDEPAWEDDAGIKHRIPAEFGKIDGKPERLLVVAWSKLHRRRDGEHYPALNTAAILTHHFFEGFDAAGFSPTKREKLEAYKAAKGLQQPERSAAFVFVDKLANGEKLWLRPEQIHKWADVDAIKIERKTSDGTSRPRGSYKGRQNGAWYSTFQADTIDTSKPVYWLHGNDYQTRSHEAIRFEVIEDDSTIVALPANRIEKFKRDFPKAINMDDAWRKHLTTVWKNFTKEDVIILSMDSGTRSVLTALDATRVDDPAIKRWIGLATRKADDTKKSTWEKYSRYTSPPAIAEDDPLDKYPLVESFPRYYAPDKRQQEHTLIYLNAAYAAAERKAS